MIQLSTCAAVMRGAKRIDLKKIADKALDICAKNGFQVSSDARCWHRLTSHVCRHARYGDLGSSFCGFLRQLAALKLLPRLQVKHSLVFENKNALSAAETPWTDGRDTWWHDNVPQQAPEAEVEWVGAEDPLFLLYTSGSTGKPKGVLHTTGVCLSSSPSQSESLLHQMSTRALAHCHSPGTAAHICRPNRLCHALAGGYMLYAATTSKFVFDLKPGDIYW